MYSIYDLYRRKSGHLCVFIIELLYIISGHLARDRSEKGYPSGFLPPVFLAEEDFLIPYPAGIFNERQVFCFSEKGVIDS